jgi:hypothetical protein
MKYTISLLMLFSFNLIADCGLQGDIKMRLKDCSNIKSSNDRLAVITNLTDKKIQYHYNKEKDLIIGPRTSKGRCKNPYKKTKLNNLKQCILKDASRYYLLGNEIEFMQ